MVSADGRLHVVFLEDDKQTVEGIIRDVESRWRSRFDFEVVSSEKTFIASIPAWEISPPDAFILDRLVRWGTVDDILTGDISDLPDDGPSQAGIRCAQLILDRNLAPPTRIALHSVIKTPALGCTVIRKSGHSRDLEGFLSTLNATSPR